MENSVGLRISYHFAHHESKKKNVYEIIVKKLDYEKKVSLWVQKNESWYDIFAEYKESLPGGFEKWVVETNDTFHKFAVKYEINGNTYWDNNGGKDYIIPHCSDFFVLTGIEFPVVLGEISFVKNTLRAYTIVQNLSIHKKVGLVYSIDNWKNYSTIFAHHLRSVNSGVEVWKISQHLPVSSEIELALFCQMNGNDYWDNNFNRNYTEQQSHGIKSESSNSELWDVTPMQRKTIEKSEKKVEQKAKDSVLMTEAL